MRKLFIYLILFLTGSFTSVYSQPHDFTKLVEIRTSLGSVLVDIIWENKNGISTFKTQSGEEIPFEDIGGLKTEEGWVILKTIIGAASPYSVAQGYVGKLTEAVYNKGMNLLWESDASIRIKEVNVGNSYEYNQTLCNFGFTGQFRRIKWGTEAGLYLKLSNINIYPRDLNARTNLGLLYYGPNVFIFTKLVSESETITATPLKIHWNDIRDAQFAYCKLPFELEQYLLNEEYHVEFHVAIVKRSPVVELANFDLHEAYQSYSPQGPETLRAYLSGTTVTLDWEAPGDQISYYKIYRGDRPSLSDISYAPDEIGRVNSPYTIFFDQSFNRFRRYYYRVSAVDVNGKESVASEEAVIYPISELHLKYATDYFTTRPNDEFTIIGEVQDQDGQAQAGAGLSFAYMNEELQTAINVFGDEDGQFSISRKAPLIAGTYQSFLTADNKGQSVTQGMTINVLPDPDVGQDLRINWITRPATQLVNNRQLSFNIELTGDNFKGQNTRLEYQIVNQMGQIIETTSENVAVGVNETTNHSKVWELSSVLAEEKYELQIKAQTDADQYPANNLLRHPFFYCEPMEGQGWKSTRECNRSGEIPDRRH